MEQGRQLEGHGKESFGDYKREQTFTALALGRLALAASSKGWGPPFSREISLVETPCSIRWPNGAESGSGAIISQDPLSPKRPHWRLSPKPQGHWTIGCSEQFGLWKLALPSWLGSFLKPGN